MAQYRRKPLIVEAMRAPGDMRIEIGPTKKLTCKRGNWLITFPDESQIVLTPEEFEKEYDKAVELAGDVMDVKVSTHDPVESAGPVVGKEPPPPPDDKIYFDPPPEGETEEAREKRLKAEKAYNADIVQRIEALDQHNIDREANGLEPLPLPADMKIKHPHPDENVRPAPPSPEPMKPRDAKSLKEDGPSVVSGQGMSPGRAEEIVATQDDQGGNDNL